MDIIDYLKLSLGMTNSGVKQNNYDSCLYFYIRQSVLKKPIKKAV